MQHETCPGRQGFGPFLFSVRVLASVLGVAVAAAFLSTASWAGSHGGPSKEAFDELENRVFELEAQQPDKAVAKSFDALDLNIGGFLTQTHATAMSSGSSDAAFDETNFELLLSAKLSESIDLFTALGWLNFVKLDETDPENRAYEGGRVQPRPAIIIWAKQRFASALELKFGRYVTAWGIIHREHFPPTLLSQQQPQHLQPINGGLGGFRTIATFINGLEATGKFFLGGSTLEYSTYVGNYTGPAPFVEGANITGGLIGLSMAGDTIQFGLNQQGGKKPRAATETTEATELDYSIVGGYLKISMNGFLLKSEIFQNDIDGDDNDQTGIYVQPAFLFGGRHVVFYRFDQFDGNDDEVSVTTDFTETTQQIIGYNYLPVPNVRLRVEFLINEFEAERNADGKELDYEMLKISGVFSF